MTETDLAAIRARCEALDELFPSAVYPHRSTDEYWAIIDRWGDAIVSVTPRFLGPQKVEAARDALFSLTTDTLLLLAEVERLRGALRDVCTLAGLPYDAGDGCRADGREEAAEIARRALDPPVD